MGRRDAVQAVAVERICCWTATICLIQILTLMFLRTKINGSMRGQADPIDPTERRRLEIVSPDELAHLYLAMRKVVRRFRIAKGKGGPRRRYKGGIARRRFRRVPGKYGGRGRKGFLVGETFVSFDAFPEEELEALFRGRKGGKSSSKVKCYRCGKLGHSVKDCNSPEVCFNCGEIGHRQAQCPNGRTANFVEEIFCPSFVGHYPAWILPAGG